MLVMGDDLEEWLEGLPPSDEPVDVTPTPTVGPKPALALPPPSGKLSPEEVFANAYVRNGHDGAAAVRKAGLQDPRYDMEYIVRGLLARSDVQALIARAEEEAPRNRNVERYTREFFLHGLQEIGERALDANQFAPAITAVKTQAQLLGMLEQTVNINHSMSPRELSLSELRAMVQKGLEGDGARRVSGRVIDGD